MIPKQYQSKKQSKGRSQNSCHFAFTSKGCTKTNCKLNHEVPQFGFCAETNCILCDLAVHSKVCLHAKCKYKDSCKKQHLDAGVTSLLISVIEAHQTKMNQLKEKLWEIGSNIEITNTLEKMFHVGLGIFQKVISTINENPGMSSTEKIIKINQQLLEFNQRFQKVDPSSLGQGPQGTPKPKGKKDKYQKQPSQPAVHKQKYQEQGIYEEKPNQNYQQQMIYEAKPNKQPNEQIVYEEKPMKQPAYKRVYEEKKTPLPVDQHPRNQSMVVYEVKGSQMKPEVETPQHEKQHKKKQEYGKKQKNKNPKEEKINQNSFNNKKKSYKEFKKDKKQKKKEFKPKKKEMAKQIIEKKPICHYFMIDGACPYQSTCPNSHSGPYYGICVELQCKVCEEQLDLDLCGSYPCGVTSCQKNHVCDPELTENIEHVQQDFLEKCQILKILIKLGADAQKQLFMQVLKLFQSFYKDFERSLSTICRRVPKEDQPSEFASLMAKIFNQIQEIWKEEWENEADKLLQSEQDEDNKAYQGDGGEYMDEDEEDFYEYMGDDKKKNEENESDSDSSSSEDQQKNNQNPQGNVYEERKLGEELKVEQQPQERMRECHDYQYGQCANENCPFEHPDHNMGICITQDCPRCKGTISLCLKKHHKFCGQNRVHLKDIKLHHRIIKALEANWNKIRAQKLKMNGLDPADNQTIDAEKDILSVLLKQRNVFQTSFAEYTHEIQTRELKESEILNIRLEISQFEASLPAYITKHEIVEESKNLENPFSLIVGPTGSGKTTQSPQYLFQQAIKNNKKIICAQPRRVATISLAKRVAEEMGFELGKEVGYQISNVKVKNQVALQSKVNKMNYLCSPETKILFVTEGLLVRKLLSLKNKDRDYDPEFFENLHGILLDEVHERNLTSDLIFGMMKDYFIKYYKNVKIFLASATVDENKFSAYFDNCRIIRIPGRTFPVEIRYRPEYEEDYINGSIEVGAEVLDEIVVQRNPDFEGHVIIFVTSIDQMQEIQLGLEEEIAKVILRQHQGGGNQRRRNNQGRRRRRRRNNEEDIDENENEDDDEEEEAKQNEPWVPYQADQFEVLWLHGRLTNQEQQLVFADRLTINGRKKFKFILSTKIAESSVTVNGVKVVIDNGFSKEAFYDAKKGITFLQIGQINQSSANQRSGRAGRTSAGICYRLYSEEMYAELSQSRAPEISRVCLDQALLKIIQFGFDPKEFPYFERPDEEKLIGSIESLKILEAVLIDEKTKSMKLTTEGLVMMNMILEPKKCKCLIQAYKNHCLEETIKIISVESIAGILFRFEEGQDGRRVCVAPKRFFEGHFKSDLICYLRIFEEWLQFVGNYKGKKHFKTREEKDWGNENKININALHKAKLLARDIQFEFENAIKFSNIKQNDIDAFDDEVKLKEKPLEEAILKCFLEGYIHTISKYSGLRKVGYVSALEGFTFYFSGSSQYSKEFSSTDELIFVTQLESSNIGNRARNVSFIPKEWLNDYKGYIKDEMLKKFKENFNYEEKSIPMSSWAAFQFKKQYKKEIDKKIEEWEKENSKAKVEFTIAEDKKSLNIIYTSSMKKPVDEYFEYLKMDFCKDIKHQTTVVPIPQTKCAAIMKNGYQVHDILLPEEFITVQFHGIEKDAKMMFEESQIALFFKLKPDAYQSIRIDFQDDKYFSGKIRFFDKLTAAAFYQDYKQLYTDCIRPFNENGNARFGQEFHRVHISYPITESTQKGMILIPNIFQANYLHQEFQNWWIDGKHIRAERGRKFKDKIFLHGLNVITDEYTLKSEIDRVSRSLGINICPTVVSVQREEIPDFLRNDKHYIEQPIKQLLKEELSRDEFKKIGGMIDIKVSEHADQLISAWVKMPSYSVMSRLIEKYHGHQDVLQNQAEFQKLRIVPQSNVMIKIYPEIFKIYQIQLEDLKNRLSVEYPKVNFKIDDKPINGCNRVRVLGNDLSELRDLAAQFSDLVSGVKVEVNGANTWKLHTKQMKDMYTRIYLTSRKKTYIKWIGLSKSLRVFQADIKEAEAVRDNILSEIGLLEDDPSMYENSISLKEYNLRLVNEYMHNKQLKEIEVCYKVDIAKRMLIFQAKKDKRGSIEEELLKYKFTSKAPQECEVCYCELDKYSISFLYCGHQLCSVCSKQFVLEEKEKSNAKVQCCCPCCQQPIATRDLEQICTDHDCEDLTSKYVDNYLIKNKQKFRYCGTKNCTNILLIDSNMVGMCLLCLEEQCFKSGEPHKNHPGMTCAEYDRSRKSGKLEIQKLIDEGLFRKSPCCGTLAEKLAGCDHMTCKACGMHWCYRCHYVTDRWSYGHFDNCTGRIPKQIYE